MKDFEEEIVENEELLNIVNQIKVLNKRDKYKNDSIKDLKKDYPDEIKELEEALLNYMGRNDLKSLKTEFPEKWKFLTKELAYPYEYFKGINDYQKPVNDLEKEDFFSKLINDHPSHDEIERKKEIIKLFNIKYGEELT